MKLRIKKSHCAGHGLCIATAPELFVLDDEGYIAIEELEVPPGKEELAREGARACPEKIITVEE
jgi:ferredoxin